MKQLTKLMAIRPSSNNHDHSPTRIGISRLMLLGALLFVQSAQAAYDVTIAASGSSSGGSWVGDTWTPSASGSTVLASEIATHLASGPTVIGTAGGGADNGDITVNGAFSWSANGLTLSAQRNIAIKASLSGSGTASLVLEYGQGAVAAGNTGTYTLSGGAQVNLPAGGNFSTKLGSDGGTVAYTVITALGAAGSVTATDLQGMSGALGGKYALGANIDACLTGGTCATPSAAWNAGAGFNPVGSFASNFTGVFDGLGHTITGLTISRAGTDYIGLFGYASAAAVLRNVGLLNSSVAGLSGVGTLVGVNGGAISYSYADGGSVSAAWNAAGGLQGGGAGKIDNSYANVSVTGVSTGAGGLKGAGSGTVSNSYATGSVNGGDAVGGLVGQSDGNISNSYATGAVTGTTNVGGLSGQVTGGTTSNSYWDTQTTGRGTSAGAAVGKTTAQMKQLATFVAWDIDDAGGTGKLWRIYEGSTYPLMRGFLTLLTVSAGSASKTYDGLAYSGGSVTYSTTPSANLLGTVSYSGTSQGAINIGSYTLTASGFWSNQRGYDITYVNGTLTIAAAPVYYDPPSIIYAPSGGTITLTGTTPVTAAPGSTLLIPSGSYVSGPHHADRADQRGSNCPRNDQDRHQHPDGDTTGQQRRPDAEERQSQRCSDPGAGAEQRHGKHRRRPRRAGDHVHQRRGDYRRYERRHGQPVHERRRHCHPGCDQRLRGATRHRLRRCRHPGQQALRRGDRADRQRRHGDASTPRLAGRRQPRRPGRPTRRAQPHRPGQDTQIGWQRRPPGQRPQHRHRRRSRKRP